MRLFADAPALRIPDGPHFLIETDAVGDGSAVLDGEDAHHLSRVLRALPGDPVSLTDGCGTRWAARVRNPEGRHVDLEVLDSWRDPEPRPALTVVHALPRGRKLDDVVQRLTEVGVDRLVPVTCARSQVELGEPERAARALRRWRAVAEAATKQSRRAWLLDVADLTSWGEAFAAFGEGVAGAVLWEEATTPLREVLKGAADADRLVLGVGPEGGLEAAEVEAAGLPGASLGPTVLRTETAALVAASAAFTLIGRLA